MKLVGATYLEEAIRQRPDCAEAVRAWRNEVQHRSWHNAADLTSCFPSVDTSNLPTVTFQVGYAPLKIETLIDMRTSVVLVMHAGATNPIETTLHISNK